MSKLALNVPSLAVDVPKLAEELPTSPNPFYGTQVNTSCCSWFTLIK
ncbi:hypothetical protein THF1D04_20504 [Vibrio owensii]|uniref:Uncharacterized protein n=1 Tax=Vibrio owensii TaxID=696485 RepID=A0AAU9Q5A5_9VIBR|nr:hypothetical protein [Vibrio owensii]CAH1527056.1 hypothetical protein THF1D04_20504 [Vibrio owensii]